jgi:hypothetical protein
MSKAEMRSRAARRAWATRRKNTGKSPATVAVPPESLNIDALKAVVTWLEEWSGATEFDPITSKMAQAALANIGGIDLATKTIMEICPDGGQPQM